MKFRIGQPFKGNMEERKITHDEVKETIENPNKKNAIDLNLLEQERTSFMPSGTGSIVYLSLRKYEVFHILILTRKKIGEICHVTDGFKVNKKLIPDIEELQPIEILERIIEKFGLPLFVDGEERRGLQKFMMVPRDEKGRLMISQGKFPVGHKFYVNAFVKISGKIGFEPVSILYAIDNTKFHEWIYTSRI